MSDKAASTVRDFFPKRITLPALRNAAANCKACDLWKVGTQTVFGEGQPEAAMLLVGEQPGDKEDRTGHPFVGPAGKLLDRALAEAGIDRETAYVTNAVKHFKWKSTASGKRRLHQKPNAREIAACKPWLEAEIEVLKPKVIVCLGATAAQTLLGKDFRVTKQRGTFIPNKLGAKVLATIHPSAILRTTNQNDREEEFAAFVTDLKTAADAVNGGPE